MKNLKLNIKIKFQDFHLFIKDLPKGAAYALKH